MERVPPQGAPGACGGPCFCVDFAFLAWPCTGSPKVPSDPDLCRFINDMWELGSFASGGTPDRPPGFQFVLWDTNARINGLVATDLETLVSEVLAPFPTNAGFANGLFVMTTATDHKNNLNRSGLKKEYARTLRVETIANSAGGTAQVAIVAQPSIGFLTQ